MTVNAEVGKQSLGYGTSALMARVRRPESRRLLDSAFDAGITHFDTARSYGYGEAESVVGDFIQGRRSEVTITTKCGILPPQRSSLLSTARVVARALVKVAPGLRENIRGRAGRMVQHGAFDPVAVRQSVETSLRELRTDYVDVLLLHDARPQQVTDELLDLLESMVDNGTIRVFGVATDYEQLTAFYATHYRPSAIQIPDDVLTRSASRLRDVDIPLLMTHSAVAPVLGRITSHLAGPVWSEVLGVDAGDPQVLGELCLAWAVKNNARGPVIFSSTSDRRIRRNAHAIHDSVHPDDRIEVFERLIREGTETS